MRGLNYAQVNALITRQTGRIVSLDAPSFAILLDALNSLGARGAWHNDNVDLTDNEWDIVENWISNAYNDLLEIYECDEEPPGGGVMKYAILQDQKATTVAGGSAAGGTWNQRVLNAEVIDADNIVTLSSNKFTPIAGTVRLWAVAPVYDVNRHRLRLYNVTQAAIVPAAGSGLYDNQDSGNSVMFAIFTANGSDEYRIDHYTGAARATDGLGMYVGDGSNEAYLTILLEVEE